MKASELIKELEKAIEEHGDLEVECRSSDGGIDPVGGACVLSDNTIQIESYWDK